MNINELNEIENVDGFLVGGASIKIDSFLKLIEVVVNQWLFSFKNDILRQN